MIHGFIIQTIKTKDHDDKAGGNIQAEDEG